MPQWWNGRHEGLSRLTKTTKESAPLETMGVEARYTEDAKLNEIDLQNGVIEVWP